MYVQLFLKSSHAGSNGTSIMQPQTPQDTHNGLSAMQTYGDKREYITVQIPDNTISPTSSADLLSTTTSQLSTPSAHLSSMPALLQPIPIATVDYGMFQAQMSGFEFEALAAQGGFEDALGEVAQADKGDVQASDAFPPPVADPAYQAPGVHYDRPEILPPQVLDLNELIVDGY